jgi:hypothetical protein
MTVLPVTVVLPTVALATLRQLMVRVKAKRKVRERGE